MGKVDWKLVETQLRAASPTAVKNDDQEPDALQTDAEVLKHIEDALRLDGTNSDSAPVRRK